MNEDNVQIYKLRDAYTDLCTEYARGKVKQLPKPDEYCQAFKEHNLYDDILKECKEIYERAEKNPVLFSPTPVPRQFSLQEWLGEGSYGVVWKATELYVKTPVALKVLKNTSITLKSKEVKALLLCHHQNVINLEYYGHFVGPHHHPFFQKRFITSAATNYEYLVLELAEGGSLKDFIPDPNHCHKVATVGQILKWMDQLASAVAHMHKNEVFHRDIKPSNVLLSKSMDVKVADFGIASIPPNENEEPETQTGKQFGSIGYQPREIVHGTPRDYKNWSPERQNDFWTAVDVWGLGAVLYALVIGEAPNGLPNWDKWPKTNNRIRRLRRVCEQCLADKQEHRYKSASAVLVALRQARVSRQGYVFAALGAVAVAAMLCFAFLPSIGQKSAGNYVVAGKPKEVSHPLPGDPILEPLVDKIRFRYRVIKGVKHAGANLIGRLYNSKEKALTKAELVGQPRELKQHQTENEFFSEVAAVPGNISLKSLLEENYAVNVEHDGGGVGHHVALRFSVEVLTSDGIWHMILKEDDPSHTFNPYENERKAGLQYYDLHNDNTRVPPSSQTTKKVTLKPKQEHARESP